MSNCTLFMTLEARLRGELTIYSNLIRICMSCKLESKLYMSPSSGLLTSKTNSSTNEAWNHMSFKSNSHWSIEDVPLKLRWLTTTTLIYSLWYERLRCLFDTCESTMWGWKTQWADSRRSTILTTNISQNYQNSWSKRSTISQILQSQGPNLLTDQRITNTAAWDRSSPNALRFVSA